MDDNARREAIIARWQQWTSNLPPRDHIIGEFHREVIEPSDIDSDIDRDPGLEIYVPHRPGYDSDASSQ